MRGGAVALLVLLLMAPAAARAQLDWASLPGSPTGEWRTLEVPGYRLHYPEPAELWARHLAARLPALRARVGTAVGWDAEDVVDVVLADPIAGPNGAAWPLLKRPRLVLLLTPPGASSPLGEYVDWPELLMVHEQTHLSHLLRPSRNPLVRMLRLPFGPLSLRAPRWTAEGYATVLEGRLTGSGRPSGALRAAVLRRWAQRGRLPSYAALSRDSRRYLGDAMAYLGGSAFLEWLDARVGEGGFDRLWRRLSARKVRSFAGAFRGVYGEPPEVLWDRFRAELGWQAVEVEKRLAGTLREGEPWLNRTWGTGRPAVSRDGDRLVVALSERDQPPRLAVYATTEDPDAARRREEERREQMARDPEDAPAVESGAPERKELATLELPGTTVEPSPRFLADGSVLFTRTRPDGDGRARADLFRWRPESGEVEMLTRHADVRAADPAPDGGWAVAVQSAWGQTRLVRVNLATGEVTPLMEGSIEVVVDAPRVSPDGERVAFLRHAGAGWELVVRELAGGAERVVATPAGAAVQDPAWSPHGDALLAVVEADGRLDVHTLALGEGEATAAQPVAITRTLGAALGPEPTPDGKALFFLALEPEGMQVRRIALEPKGATTAEAKPSSAGSETNPPSTGSDTKPSLGGSTVAAPPPPRALDAAELHPALPPPAGTPPPPLAFSEVPASRDYGFGRGKWSQLSGGSAGPGAASAETAVRGGDIVGRWELLAVAAVGTGGGARGGTLAGVWRGWPVELSAQAYHVREKPSDQREVAREAGGLFDLATDGVEIAGAWQRPLLDGRLGARLAFGEENLQPRHAAELTRRGALLEATAAKVLRRGRWRAGGELAFSGAAGTTGGESWDRRGARVELSLGRGRSGLEVTAARHELGGRPSAVDQLRVGGLPSTLLPPFAIANRIEVPALPPAALVGSAYEGQRVALILPQGPLQPFWERHRVERASGWSEWLSLAGLELELRLPPLPLFDLPAARLRVGAAYGLDEPYHGDVNGWAVLAWRP
ncbi:MAG TPA: hypothetical protein VN811_00145 [Thermoanaerobaculia bacterium]|nr:hypothetical protein [Thermoanaerobaculia bacterium]